MKSESKRDARPTARPMVLAATAAATATALAVTTLPAAAQSAAPAAAPASSVTIYGLFDAAMREANNASANRQRLRTMEDGIFTGSRLGLRGREDLGGGLVAVFTLESGYDPSTGTSLQGTPSGDFGQATAPTRFWGRESHVGLRTAWGGVTLGRQYTVAHGLAARFQPLGNPNSAAHSLFSSHHIARQDNQVRFDAKAAGVDWAASTTFGEQAATSANSSWAFGAGYAQGALALGAYVQQMKNLAGTETRKIVGAGGNYRFAPVFQLFAGVMQRTSAVSVQENLAFTIGANIRLTEQSTLSVAHYDDEQSGSAALDGSRQVSWVTVNYAFSRRTDLYAVVDTNVVEGGYAKPAFMGTKGSQTGLALGLRHRF
ncbi:MAG: porin [Burkholderiales bacterium]|nr:porin [Burkholderiales bacterium]